MDKSILRVRSKTNKQQLVQQHYNAYYMKDNYESERHSWDRVYLHQQSNHWIYLGDVQSAQNLNFIHSHRIATVVTAALGMDHLDYSQVDVKHIIYPLIDHQHRKYSQLFDEFYNIIDRQIKIGNLLLHCSTGLSSSPALLITYIMKKDDLTYKNALEQLRQSRPRVHPSLSIDRQLKLYEKHLRGQQNSMVFTRHSVCRTSANIRPLSIIKYTELPSFNNQSLPQAKTGHRKGTFQVRSFKRKSLDPKWRPPSSFYSFRGRKESEQSSVLNFEVLKLAIRERVLVKSSLSGRVLNK